MRPAPMPAHRSAPAPASSSHPIAWRTSRSTGMTWWSTSPRPQPTGHPAAPTPPSLLKRSSTSWQRSWPSIRSNSAASMRPVRAIGRPDGPIYSRIGFAETLAAAQAHPHLTAPLPESSDGTLVGRGVASGFWFNGGGRSSVFASVNPDGTVKLVEGSTDIGGFTRRHLYAARRDHRHRRRGGHS